MGGSGSGGPKGWGPEGVGARRGGGPKISRFFFSLPPEISFFCLSLGGLLVEFWWCLKRRDAQMCAFGVLWLSCEAPAGASAGVCTGRHGRVGHQPEQPWMWGAQSMTQKPEVRVGNTTVLWNCH